MVDTYDQRRKEALPHWKRALDLGCIVLALPALLPVMAIIALAIRISSRGPILFRQERIGFLGRPFTCLKFRTMQAEAETRSHQAHLDRLINSSAPMNKLDGMDNRIFPVGLFLRATGLDELPQLINVLYGEMSLVGPRPSLRYEYERFSPEHCARFNALPGLTGLWQVSGKNNTTFQEMIDLDVAYTRRISFRDDVRILALTFPVLFQQTRQIAHRKNNRNEHARGSLPPMHTETRRNPKPVGSL